MARKKLAADVRTEGGRTTVFFTGSIDEYAGPVLMMTLGRLAGEVDFNLRQLESINSTGVATLASALRGFNGRVRYVEMPAAFVSTINMVPSLLVNASVGSVLAPFTCKTCDETVQVPVAAGRKAEARRACQGAACSTCNQRMELDVDFDDYFGYLAA